jgi:hypothetical protein
MKPSDRQHAMALQATFQSWEKPIHFGGFLCINTKPVFPDLTGQVQDTDAGRMCLCQCIPKNRMGSMSGKAFLRQANKLFLIKSP